MNILVFGGAGYIGSVVSMQLLAHGHRVTIADNLSTGHSWAIPAGASFERADLLDPESLRVVVRREFDAVMHFAAKSLVSESVRDPLSYYHANITGTVNLMAAMRAAGVKRLIFSSTAAVYGEPDQTPITETAPTRPTSPYGASKLAIDQLIGFECAASDVQAVSLRYFNVAGASGHLGEAHDTETHLIPLVLAAATGDRPDVKIFGTDYPTPDGTAVRDYIHVEDLANAHLLALDSLTEPGHRIFNLGNGTGYSVREVIEVARAVTGRDFGVEEAPRRPGDPAVLVASSDRISAEIGWQTTKPGLGEIVSDAWRFWLDRLGTHSG